MANVLTVKIGLGDNIKVQAFDEEWESVGIFESIGDASRKLFIRNTNTIWGYLNGGKNYTFTCKKKGVKSYKTGKRYHFKKVTNE